MEAKIQALIKQFKHLGNTHVIYCLDTDRFDNDPTDRHMLNDVAKYCKDNGYDLVWFCHDIEEVFLGNSISGKDKTVEARRYASNEGINRVKLSSLKSDVMTKGKSNLVSVLCKYIAMIEG